MKYLKKFLNQRPRTKRFVVYYIFAMKLYGKLIIKLFLGRFLRRSANVLKKPQVLQLPITYKCNCDCIMCGMKKMQHMENFSYTDLEAILDDELYSEIISVGVNGGEPFMVKDIESFVDVLLDKLPKLRAIYIISNGYFTNQMLAKLKIIKNKCLKRTVKVTISISIDGLESTHDEIRKISGVFKKAIDSYRRINNEKELYCDSLGAICTITTRNIININELEALVKIENINMSYNVATLHERLFNESRFEDFSVFSKDKYKTLAAEFFYGKFIETKSQIYFALWYYILNNERISFCNFSNNGVTITPDSNISFCATKSKILGNAKQNSSYDIYKEHLDYRYELTSKECKSCSHYTSSLTLKGAIKYNSELLNLIGNPFKFWR